MHVYNDDVVIPLICYTKYTKYTLLIIYSAQWGEKIDIKVLPSYDN